MQLGIPTDVTPSEVIRKATLGSAISLCAEAAGLEPKAIQADLQKRGAYVCTLSRKAKITATIRQRHTKLKGGMAEARQIRESDDSEKVLAERHGISISHVNRIRNGHAWRETVGPASIFSMGGRP